MDQAQISATKAMGMIPPKVFEGLFKDSATLELVGIKNYGRGKAIYDAVKVTNQADMETSFREGEECWSFDIGGQSATKRCNFLVVTGEIFATIPKSDLVKKKGFGPIRQENYEVDNIFKNIPGKVAKYKGYTELYLEKHQATNTTLKATHLKTKMSVFRCGTGRDDGYLEHCPSLHGMQLSALQKEEVITVDPKKEFRCVRRKTLKRAVQ